MKFTKIPTNTFSQLQLNAGILLSDFAPSTGTVDEDDIIGATSGGNSFTAVPTFSDYGEDVDNCPKNTKELKRLDEWDIKMTGTFVTVNTALGKRLAAAADVGTTDTSKITLRNDLASADFSDIWWVGDYSDKNGASNGGFVAIKLKDALSTGGFQIQSADNGKGQFAYEFTAHYSISSPDTVPCEIYIKAGTAEPTSGGSGET